MSLALYEAISDGTWVSSHSEQRIWFAGTQQVASTLHWGPDFQSNQWALTHYELNDEAGFDTDFHVYKMDWTPGTSESPVEDALVATISLPSHRYLQQYRVTSTLCIVTRTAPQAHRHCTVYYRYSG